MTRTHIPALSPFEESIGFSRALRVGDQVFVSGLTATLPDGSVPASAGDQADHIFAEIIRHIETLGGKATHVVRVRMFATDIADADALSAAFSRALGHVRPAATLVAISGLYRPEWKVEIEADAVITAD